MKSEFADRASLNDNCHGTINFATPRNKLETRESRVIKKKKEREEKETRELKTNRADRGIYQNGKRDRSNSAAGVRFSRT